MTTLRGDGVVRSERGRVAGKDGRVRISITRTYDVPDEVALDVVPEGSGGVYFPGRCDLEAFPPLLCFEKTVAITAERGSTDSENQKRREANRYDEESS